MQGIRRSTVPQRQREIDRERSAMESMVGASKDKRGGREEPAGTALGFAFNFGSSSSPPSPPHKLVRTAAFPFRIEPNNGCSVQQAQWFLSSARDVHPLCKPQGAATLPLPLRTGCAFTPSQWQELQRQALIYKHLMSSVPVPADLLLPISARYFPVAGGGGGCYALRLNGAIDPEPGRCRRTDGKKWRCSRDVAPDQKYCERHVHRGRPRSRKPVEIQKQEATASPRVPTSTAGAAVLPKGLPAQSPALFTEASKEPRYLDWMKDSSRDQLTPKHKWEIMHSNIEAQLNLSYTNPSSQYSSFHNTDLSSLEERAIGDHRGTPRSFIDAWSTEAPITTTTTNGDKLFSALSGKSPVSNLSLSMRSEIEEGIQMGLGIREYSMGMKPQPLNWMGGPLAEVLGRSGSGTPSPHLIDIMSKSNYVGHEASPRESPTRVSSSPSGVLQKALVSLSDSSSCSSPTFGAAATKPEVAFQWFK